MSKTSSFMYSVVESVFTGLNKNDQKETKRVDPLLLDAPASLTNAMRVAVTSAGVMRNIPKQAGVI